MQHDSRTICGAALATYFVGGACAAVFPLLQTNSATLFEVQLRAEDIGIGIQCNLVAFWVSQGTASAVWKTAWLFLAAAALTWQRYMFLTTMMLFEFDVVFWCGIAASVIVCYLAYALALPCRMDWQHEPAQQRPLQWSLRHMMYAVGLLGVWYVWLSCSRWLISRYGICDVIYSHSAVFGVLASWALLRVGRMGAATVLVVASVSVSECLMYQSLGERLPTINWSSRLVEAVILVAAFATMRLCGCRLVAKHEADRQPASATT